ncbi:MAG TPA: 8-amino-7-oxononanoate synthase [Isosphaeraceae bacterium]|jgi:8-amino-7-oxononanoate synthase|nr:8-amino-7-oxononanoate synthase [Isosphaeraceae bacterium]
MWDPLAWIDDEAAAWAQKGLKRRLRALGQATEGHVQFDGQVLINFSSNDYLGLAADPRVVAAGVRAANEFGWGAGASPLVSGWGQPHQALAEALARFEQAEAAVLFPTGYAANLGTITALVGRGDAVFSDQLNHACLIDGARLSGARIFIYPHADAGALEDLLRQNRGAARRALIITDGLFSMDGDLAPLAELVALAERFEAMLLVDEAHGTGVFGPDGRGAASECGVADRVPVRVGTLSKALGSVGGFVAGSQRLIDWLINHARPLIFSTALPPAAAAAALEALTIAQAEPWRRERVRALGERLRVRLNEAGHDVGHSTGPIIPVVIGDPERTLALADRLLARGMLVPAIRPPSVPTGTSRLRVGLSAVHRDEDVDALAAAIIEESAR